MDVLERGVFLQGQTVDLIAFRSPFKLQAFITAEGAVSQKKVNLGISLSIPGTSEGTFYRKTKPNLGHF